MKKWIHTVLLLLGGTGSMAQNVLKVPAGVVVSTTGGAVITLSDLDLVNDGIINSSAGQGVFVFAGSGNNRLSGAGTPTLDRLRIAKSGTGTLVLQQGVNIGSAVEFGSGLIDLNGNNIVLGSGAVLSGESVASRIVGSTGGYVEATGVLNAPAGVNPGNLGVVISSAQDLGNTIVRRGHAAQVIDGGGSNGSSILRYYDIQPSNDAGLNATLRFNYFDGELNGQDEGGLILWKSEDDVNWMLQGFTSRDINAHYVEKTGIDQLSRWTLSSSGVNLPLQFLSFTARCNGNTVSLQWATAQEQNTASFLVQRSSDGSDWKTIGKLAAAGNSMGQRDYEYTDALLPGEQAFYRVAEVDLDGRNQLTSVAATSCRVAETVRCWPNPVKDQLSMEIITVASSRAAVRLFDARGALLWVSELSLSPGANELSLAMGSYPAGIYHVVVSWNSGAGEKRMDILKVQ
jgi:hypothetical protein